jgi:hypothetical protein
MRTVDGKKRGLPRKVGFNTRNYRKESDEDRATFRDKPIHNWPPHGADSFRNFAQ